MVGKLVKQTQPLKPDILVLETINQVFKFKIKISKNMFKEKMNAHHQFKELHCPKMIFNSSIAQ